MRSTVHALAPVAYSLLIGRSCSCFLRGDTAQSAHPLSNSVQVAELEDTGRVKVVYFEALKVDLGGELDSLAEFLGRPLSPAKKVSALAHTHTHRERESVCACVRVCVCACVREREREEREERDKNPFYSDLLWVG